MPHWTLNCKQCSKGFNHSNVDPRFNGMPYDSLWPYRPEFPDGGFTTNCPHCKKSSTYQRFELIYRPD
jgi:hypothetical protein